MSTAALEIADLVAGYNDMTILHGVKIRVPAHGVVVIIGRNGAGKSTLLKAIYGLARVRTGSIVLAPHQEVRGRPPHELTRLGMNYVPQVKNVFPNLTVRENIAVGQCGHRVGREAVGKVKALFPRLVERWSQRAGTLSGGERQMVALARALVSDPTVLLLDEPSAGLSPSVVKEVFELLGQIRAELGVAMLIVEQNAKRALSMADYAYVLEMGRNIYEGSGAELLGDHRVAELYMGRQPGR
jgi:neutral amino acid transport system ATP-binding protein